MYELLPIKIIPIQKITIYVAGSQTLGLSDHRQDPPPSRLFRDSHPLRKHIADPVIVGSA